MATKTFTVGQSYRLIFGNFFQKNDLQIKGDGTDATVAIESTSIFGVNIPTTLFGNVNGKRKFDATFINDGVSFVGTAGDETFDASKYIGNVKFNGGAGENTLTGAAGKNVFTHDYDNNGTDTIFGGQDKQVSWKEPTWQWPLFVTKSFTHKASNNLIVNGRDEANNIFRLVGDSNDAVKVFDTLRSNTTSPARIDASTFGPEAKIQLKGKGGDDTADLRAFKGTVEFNGGAGKDNLQFLHGTSGAGSLYDGGDGSDSLQVFAKGSGSDLKLTSSELTDEGDAGKTLLMLNSVEVAGFNGGAGDDTFDASEFTGHVSANLGGGNNVFHSSKANNNLVTRALANKGHDEIHGNPSVTTNIRIQDTAGHDELVFNGTSTSFTVTHNGNEVIDARTVKGGITFTGTSGNDTVDLREFNGAVKFLAGAEGNTGDDRLIFEHGFSGRGSEFNGGKNGDTLEVYAATAGSALRVNAKALSDDDGELVKLTDVDYFVFHGKAGPDNVTVRDVVNATLFGGDGDDVFDVNTASWGSSESNLGGGNNIFKSSGGNIHHITRTLSNNGHDTIQNNASFATNLYIKGTDVSDALVFEGANHKFTVTHNGKEVINADGVEGEITFTGTSGDDTVDLRDFDGAVKFDGGIGDDALKFRHGVSGAGSAFDGGGGDDTLYVLAQEAGSTLTLDDSGALKDSDTTLVALTNVENVDFTGEEGADNLFAKDWHTPGRTIAFSGGGGDNALIAGSGIANVTHDLANDPTDTVSSENGTVNLTIAGKTGALSNPARSDSVVFSDIEDGYTAKQINANSGLDEITVTGDNRAGDIRFDGFDGSDTADVRAFSRAITFNGGAQNDTLLFRHDTSAAGTIFDGGIGNDELRFWADTRENQKSILKLVNTADDASGNGLFEVGQDTPLVQLQNVELLQLNGSTKVGAVTTQTNGFDIDVTEANFTRLEANGSEHADSVKFQHGTSKAGATFNGGNGDDTLYLLAKAEGSTLTLDASGALKEGDTTLVALTNVENVDFTGSGATDTFDATNFAGKVLLDGGDGNDILKAGSGGSEIIGGTGADEITLGDGADRVIYDAEGQSTAAQRDKVIDFNVNADKFVFAAGNTVQTGGDIHDGLFVEARFDNGIVEYRTWAVVWSDWKTDLDDNVAAKVALGITNFNSAIGLIAKNIGPDQVAAFEFEDTWYVLESGASAGNPGNVDNLIQLVGTTLNTSSNLTDFVEFLSA